MKHFGFSQPFYVTNAGTAPAALSGFLEIANQLEVWAKKIDIPGSAELIADLNKAGSDGVFEDHIPDLRARVAKVSCWHSFT